MHLVKRLAAQLDIPLEDADRLLEQFLQEAREELQQGRRVELPGIGTFRKTASGEVDFVPDPSLEAVVNHRYAGLSTLEVSPAPVSSARPDPTTAERTDGPDPSPGDQSAQTDAASEAAEDELDALDEDVDRFWDEQRRESPLGPHPETAEETSYSIVDGPTETEEEEQPPTEDSHLHQQETAPAEKNDSPKEPPSQATFPRKPRSSHTTGRRKLSIVAGLLITSGIVLLLYFAWFRDPMTSSPSEPAETTTSAPTASVEGSQADDNVQTGSPPAPAGSSPSSGTSAEPSSASSEADDNSPFESPLHSAESIDPEHGGYAWIVASLRERATAEELRDTYEQNGFRTAILRGGSGYRVAVGQFETIQDVLATRDELPEDVSSSAWVLKIESNMSPSVSS